MNRFFLIAIILVITGCAGRDDRSGHKLRSFPEVQIPSVITERDAQMDYCLSHFWDGFLDTATVWYCDSVTVAGVSDKALATQTASYCQMIQMLPLERASELVRRFFGQLENYQKARPESNLFEKMTETVEFYLYDPNSGIRDEDLFGPFALAMSESSMIDEDKKISYAYQAEMCSLNRRGTPAADFNFVDTDGQLRHLYAERATHSVVIFVNPGCKACKDAVDAFSTPHIIEMVQAGELKIFGIYIDEDIDKWLEEVPDLPSHWICGYDPNFEIRQSVSYNVRAIPSIYILDSDKRVIMKDATPQKANYFLENL